MRIKSRSVFGDEDQKVIWSWSWRITLAKSGGWGGGSLNVGQNSKKEELFKC